MHFDPIAGIGLAGVVGLQLLTLWRTRKTEKFMSDLAAQQAKLAAAESDLQTAVQKIIAGFQTVSTELQQANDQLKALGAGVDLTPQINAVTTLTQAISQALATAGPVSGSVVDATGARLAGVAVSAGGQTATTAADGTYSIPNVPLGPATVTPSLGSDVFNPPSASVTVVAAGLTGVNFAVAPAPNPTPAGGTPASGP